MSQVPCFNRPNRHELCHDTCSAYKVYKDRRQTISDARKQANFIQEYFQNAVDRSMKIRRLHG